MVKKSEKRSIYLPLIFLGLLIISFIIFQLKFTYPKNNDSKKDVYKFENRTIINSCTDNKLCERIEEIVNVIELEQFDKIPKLAETSTFRCTEYTKNQENPIDYAFTPNACSNLKSNKNVEGFPVGYLYSEGGPETEDGFINRFSSTFPKNNGYQYIGFLEDENTAIISYMKPETNEVFAIGIKKYNEQWKISGILLGKDFYNEFNPLKKSALSFVPEINKF